MHIHPYSYFYIFIYTYTHTYVHMCTPYCSEQVSTTEHDSKCGRQQSEIRPAASDQQRAGDLLGLTWQPRTTVQGLTQHPKAPVQDMVSFLKLLFRTGLTS